MTVNELVELAEKDPSAVDTTTKALKHVVDFNEGRGAMLAGLRPDSQKARIMHQRNKDPSKCQ